MRIPPSLLRRRRGLLAGLAGCRVTNGAVTNGARPAYMGESW